MSTAIRIGIGIGSFVVIFAILLVFAAIRRRRLARANMAFVQTSQNQQQGLPNQYPPPPPQGGFPGAPFDANGQKAQQAYNPQQYNGQYDTQYNGQYNPQYNGPQYPPATYEQGTGTPTQPVSMILIPSLHPFSSLSCRCRLILAMRHPPVLPLRDTPITFRELA